MTDPELSFALVIEPDLTERHSATRLLEDLGFAVFAASDVDEACTLGEAAPTLDVILSGVPLSAGGGSTVAELAAHWTAALLLCAFDSTFEQRRRLRGITNLVFLPRPLALGDVRSALASRRSAS